MKKKRDLRKQQKQQKNNSNKSHGPVDDGVVEPDPHPRVGRLALVDDQGRGGGGGGGGGSSAGGGTSCSRSCCPSGAARHPAVPQPLERAPPAGGAPAQREPRLRHGVTARPESAHAFAQVAEEMRRLLEERVGGVVLVRRVCGLAGGPGGGLDERDKGRDKGSSPSSGGRGSRSAGRRAGGRSGCGV